MKFALFRHASKGIIPFDDPELTAQGFQQSIQILNLIKTNELPTPTHLFVSPKRRTSQTLYPASKEFSVPIQIKPELDLRQQDESPAQFRSRIENFLNSVSQHGNEDVVFACTHYDWIEESMTLIDCDRNLNSFEFSHWAPTQFILFEISKSGWKLLKKGDAK